MPSFNDFANTGDIVHAATNGPIDPAEPLEFDDGKPAYLHGILFKTGKCRMVRTSTSNHAELWAELYERGVRYIVHEEPDGGQGFMFGEYGAPMEIWDEDRMWPKHPRRLRNLIVEAADTRGMDESDLWGMFA